MKQGNPRMDLLFRLTMYHRAAKKRLAESRAGIHGNGMRAYYKAYLPLHIEQLELWTGRLEAAESF